MISGFVTSNSLTTNYALKSDLFSKKYEDLINKPTLFSGDYNDLIHKPTLFSGQYVDLIGKPKIPTKVSDLSDGTKVITTDTLPINVSYFENDAGYITSEALEGYALLDNIPTTVAELTDSDDYALKSEIPTKISQLTNDLDYSSLHKDDHTAFEVLPHTNQILSDSIISNTILSGNITDNTVLNAVVKKTVEPRTLHRIKIRTNQADPSKSDVIIDWGDGTSSSVANQDYEAANSSINVADKEGEYVFSLDYAQALTEANLTSKRFTVRIFGKQYYNISHRIDSAGTLLSNLMCRCFEEDLYLASNMRNISNFCNGSDVLVYASFEAVKYNYFENMQGLFTSCHNLVKAIGFGAITTVATCGSLFSACTALVATDFVMPMNTVRHNSFEMIFNSCTSLTKDISTLFPKVWSIKGVSVSADGMFKWCNHLTGTVPAHLLWANPDITWTNTSTAFSNSSDEIRAQIPTSWGGTNTEIQAKLDAGYYNLVTKEYIERIN